MFRSSKNNATAPWPDNSMQAPLVSGPGRIPRPPVAQKPHKAAAAPPQRTVATAPNARNAAHELPDFVKAVLRPKFGAPTLANRVIAWCVDWAIVSFMFGQLWRTGLFDRFVPEGSSGDIFRLPLLGLVILGGMRIAYGIVMEASPWQATFGKRLTGLIVTDQNGNRPNLRAVILRNAVTQIISGFGLFVVINFIIANARADRRSLDDLIGGTRVLRRA
jgi:uncharacterized RDD family membrane protein YckC